MNENDFLDTIKKLSEQISGILGFINTINEALMRVQTQTISMEKTLLEQNIIDIELYKKNLQLVVDEFNKKIEQSVAQMKDEAEKTQQK